MTQFVIEGSERLRAALRASGDEAMRALGSALYNEANSIMNDSKAEVPVDWGTLRASGTVFPPTYSGTVVEVELGYGGAAQAYAVIQHERLDYHHNVGKALYLSDPMMRHATGMEARLAADVASRRLFPGI